MRLEIQDVAAHQVRIAKVDAFLADALVAERSYDDFFRHSPCRCTASVTSFVPEN